MSKELKQANQAKMESILTRLYGEKYTKATKARKRALETQYKRNPQAFQNLLDQQNADQVTSRPLSVDQQPLSVQIAQPKVSIPQNFQITKSVPTEQTVINYPVVSDQSSTPQQVLDPGVRQVRIGGDGTYGKRLVDVNTGKVISDPNNVYISEDPELTVRNNLNGIVVTAQAPQKGAIRRFADELADNPITGDTRSYLTTQKTYGGQKFWDTETGKAVTEGGNIAGNIALAPATLALLATGIGGIVQLLAAGEYAAVGAAIAGGYVTREAVDQAVRGMTGNKYQGFADFMSQNTGMWEAQAEAWHPGTVFGGDAATRLAQGVKSGVILNNMQATTARQAPFQVNGEPVMIQPGESVPMPAMAADAPGYSRGGARTFGQKTVNGTTGSTRGRGKSHKTTVPSRGQATSVSEVYDARMGVKGNTPVVTNNGQVQVGSYVDAWPYFYTPQEQEEVPVTPPVTPPTDPIATRLVEQSSFQDPFLPWFGKYGPEYEETIQYWEGHPNSVHRPGWYVITRKNPDPGPIIMRRVGIGSDNTGRTRGAVVGDSTTRTQAPIGTEMQPVQVVEVEGGVDPRAVAGPEMIAGYKKGAKLVPKAFLGIRLKKKDASERAVEGNMDLNLYREYGDQMNNRKFRKWAEQEYVQALNEDQAHSGLTGDELENFGLNYKYTDAARKPIGTYGMRYDESGEDYFNRFKQESGLADGQQKTLNSISGNAPKETLTVTPNGEGDDYINGLMGNTERDINKRVTKKPKPPTKPVRIVQQPGDLMVNIGGGFTPTTGNSSYDTLFFGALPNNNDTSANDFRYRYSYPDPISNPVEDLGNIDYNLPVSKTNFNQVSNLVSLQESPIFKNVTRQDIISTLDYLINNPDNFNQAGLFIADGIGPMKGKNVQFRRINSSTYAVYDPSINKWVRLQV